MMRPAHCRTCGETVGHNPKAVGRIGTKGPTMGLPLSGWHHRDGMQRDHEAAPHDMRSPEVEAQRTGDNATFARMQVDHQLGKQMDQANVEHAVNEVFRDRRS